MPTSPDPPGRPSLLATLATVVGGTIAFGFVLFFLLGPGPPLVVGSLFALIVLHYVTWGWRLSSGTQRPTDDQPGGKPEPREEPDSH